MRYERSNLFIRIKKTQILLLGVSLHNVVILNYSCIVLHSTTVFIMGIKIKNGIKEILSIEFIITYRSQIRMRFIMLANYFV